MATCRGQACSPGAEGDGNFVASSFAPEPALAASASTKTSATSRDAPVMCVPAVWVDDLRHPANLRLPAGAETLLFRVAREAPDNVRKHAAASRVAVTLAVDGGTATPTVTDDGRGVRSRMNPRTRTRASACGCSRTS